jgi:ABC-type lipoprotein release transport system permease subunit
VRVSNLTAVVQMVAQRSLGHWRLALAMTTGAILCAALLACVVLYSDAVRDLGLAHQLRSQPRFDIDIRVQSTSQRFDPEAYEQLVLTTDNLIRLHSDGYRRDQVRYGRSATFFPAPPGEPYPEADDRLRAHFQFMSDLESHVVLVEGRAPRPGSQAPPGEPPLVEVWLGKASADESNVHVGDRFDLHPHWRPVAPVRVEVVGIIEPIDPGEDYWFGRTDRFQITGNRWSTLPFFADEGTVINVVGAYLQDMGGSLETMVFVDRHAINSGNAQTVENRARALVRDVQAQLRITRVETRLADVIEQYRQKLFFTRLPLFALMIQIVGIVLFYLVMVSTMVVDRQTGEIALLKSRGAGTRQVMTVFFIEGMGIAVLATLIGPLVAWGVIAVLGLTPPFEELSQGALLDVRVTPLAFGFAALGGLLSLAALLLPAYRASRFSITNYKQQISRPPRQPAFLRYYLDLALVGAGAIAFYQLRQRGSFVTESLFGDLSADPILLATPTLFMLMVALVFLRLFPLALRLILWATRPLNGASIPVALTRMARSPLQHSRLILLLILATAVGMFAAGFRATLERGYEDRAAYRAGAELRFVDIRTPGNVPGHLLIENLESDFAEYTAATGRTVASGGTPVIRLSGSYNATRFLSESLTLLGVVPDEMANTMLWRDDYAGESPGRLFARLEQDPAPIVDGPALPPDTRYIGVWAQNPLPQRQAPMGIRLRDKDGAIWEYRLVTGQQPGVIDPSTGAAWQFYITDVTRPLSVRPAEIQPAAAFREWTFAGFYVALPGSPPDIAQPVSVLIDDLTTFPGTLDPALFQEPDWHLKGLPGGTVIETFDDVGNYELIKGITQAGDPGSLSRAVIDGDRTGFAARLSFIRGRGGSPLVSFRAVRDSRPLPVLADDAFLDRNKISVGDEILLFVNSQYVSVRIAGRFNLWPGGYDPELKRGLLIAEQQALFDTATRMPGAGSNAYPNEVWFSSAGSQEVTTEWLKERGLNVQEVLGRAQILREQAADPLVAASWEGILFISFAAVLIVSALGFVTYASLGAQERSLEFAILRTMGLSGRQILSVVSFEQLFVVVAGVVAGTLLGFPLSRLMIDYMGLTEDGRSPLPPLQSVINWQTVITVYGLLMVVVASTVVTLVALYSRIAVSRALRMGEL